jgi:hypothetical protein
MSFSARPIYYCLRPDGTAAPFIAVDELPPHLYIRGAPRRLPETEGMICLGMFGFPRQSYIVESSPPNIAEEHRGMTGPSTSVNSVGSRHLMNPQSSAQFNTSRQDARRPRRKKVFCSFWIRHGECDYEQQGDWRYCNPEALIFI